MASTLPPGHSAELRNVAVELRFNSGDFDQGFYVSLQIYNDGTPVGAYKYYNLPPSPELRNYYCQWAEQYESLGHQWRDISSVPGQETHHASYKDYKGYEKSLKDNLRQWFKHDQFNLISEVIQGKSLVQQDPSVPIIFDFVTPNRETNNFLRKIPWHRWPLFSKLGKAEVALSIGHKPQPTVLRNPVRILAIFGGEKEHSDQNLQAALKLEKDKDELENILHSKNAVVEIIEQPTTEKLHRYLRDERGWDIFFFTGHSTSTANDGRLLINENHSISLEDLEDDFREALYNGLKLAIFNSCKGLGIADFFAGWSDDFRFGNLSIPNLVVMREAVPDFVARHFFKVFLEQFVNGSPIYKAIRYARGNLQYLGGNETPYPCPSWIPVIALSPSWPELYWPEPEAVAPEPEPVTPEPEPEPVAVAPEPELEPVAPEPEPEPVAPEHGFSINWKKWLSIIGGISVVLLLSQYCKIPGSENEGGGPALVSSEQLISAGGNVNLEGSRQLEGQFAELKNKGIRAFESKKYKDALNSFSEIRSTARAQRQNFPEGSPEYNEATKALQDPEVLIYKNNAQARLNHQAGEPIYTIAVAVPLTNNQGELFDIGKQMLFGIAQIQDKVIRGDGYDEQKNLEVVIANDRNDPEQAVALAKSLVEDERNILAVVGHYISDSTCKALEEAYDKASLTVISPLSTKTNLRDCGPTNQFFRNISSTQIEAETLVNYLARENDSSNLTVGIFYYEKDPYSKDLFIKFERALENKQIKVVKRFKLGNKAFSPESALNELQDVDALIVIPDGKNSGSAAFDQAFAVIEKNAGEKVVLASSPLYHAEVTERARRAGVFSLLQDKLFVATDWHKACASQDFNQETQGYWLGGVNRTTMLSYEAVEALLPALKPGVTSEQLSDQLNNSSNPPQSSIFKDRTISFRDGDRVEIQQRIITTVGENENDPFVVVGDCP